MTDGRSDAEHVHTCAQQRLSATRGAGRATEHRSPSRYTYTSSLRAPTCGEVSLRSTSLTADAVRNSGPLLVLPPPPLPLCGRSTERCWMPAAANSSLTACFSSRGVGSGESLLAGEAGGQKRVEKMGR